jgi:hypothetical protein
MARSSLIFNQGITLRFSPQSRTRIVKDQNGDFDLSRVVTLVPDMI